MAGRRREARPPTMSDVARLAGVSAQTVSRVLNDYEFIKQDTRDRVQRAIASLGYRPNSAARALVTRRSATIGVIGSKSGYWGPSTVHRTIQAAGTGVIEVERGGVGATLQEDAGGQGVGVGGNNDEHAGASGRAVIWAVASAPPIPLPNCKSISTTSMSPWAARMTASSAVAASATTM